MVLPLSDPLEATWRRSEVIGHFKKGQTLFYQDHSPYGALVLLKGSIALVDAAPRGRVVGRITAPGAVVIGLQQVVSQQPFPCSGVAEDDLEIFCIEKSRVFQMIRMDHQCFPGLEVAYGTTLK